MSKPIIPWIGGKRRLAKQILPLFPDHTCYVEPFAGGAALFFMKDPAKIEVINDVNGDVVNLYRCVANHLEELVKQFRWSLVSRQMFEWAQMTHPDTLTDIQRAARFLYLQKACFGSRVDKQHFGTRASAPPTLNLLRIEEELSLAHLRLARVTIEHLDWQACVRRYDRPHTLFYLDPPYYGTAGYGVDFPLDQYTAMAELLRTMAGKAVVSVNDIPEMREAFAGLHIRATDIAYTVGGGAKAKQAGELIISNFRPES